MTRTVSYNKAWRNIQIYTLNIKVVVRCYRLSNQDWLAMVSGRVLPSPVDGCEFLGGRRWLGRLPWERGVSLNLSGYCRCCCGLFPPCCGCDGCGCDGCWCCCSLFLRRAFRPFDDWEAAATAAAGSIGGGQYHDYLAEAMLSWWGLLRSGARQLGLMTPT